MTHAVLLYHHVLPWASDRYAVTPEGLRAQVAWLIDAGFTLPPLRDFRAKSPGERRAFITFDDGYEDVYRHAFPVLREFNAAASIFLITDYIGRSNEWEHEGLPRSTHLDATQIAELCASGWEMHSHTASHADFRRLSDAEVAADVRRATGVIRRWNNGPLFCAFPYGRSEPRLIDHFKEQGYAGAFVGEPSWPEGDPYRLPRVPVTDDSPDALWRLLEEVSS
jgi:peptidoglycan/xylan/chitin deacetylase (PgdA/CDA1 family)